MKKRNKGSIPPKHPHYNPKRLKKEARLLKEYYNKKNEP